MSQALENKADDTMLYSRIAQIIALARQKVASTVNLTMVHTYFEIGRMIVEEEQQGKERAAYGKAVLKALSVKLLATFGKGFSVDNLERMKKFYLVYSPYISASALRKSDNPISASLLRKLEATEIPNHLENQALAYCSANIKKTPW